MPAALRRLPIEAIKISRRRPLRRFAFRQLARVDAARVVGGDQDIKVPRRSLRMRFAVRLDHGRRIHAETLRGPRLQPRPVERQGLGRRPVIEGFLGPGPSNEQRDFRGHGGARGIPGIGRDRLAVDHRRVCRVPRRRLAGFLQGRRIGRQQPVQRNRLQFARLIPVSLSGADESLGVGAYLAG